MSPTEEWVARFLTQSGDFWHKKQKTGVLWESLRPKRDSNERLTLSVCDSSVDLREAGKVPAQMRNPANPKLWGWAKLPLDAITQKSLFVVRDDTPFNGHSNIEGWDEIPAEEHEVISRFIAKKSSIEILPEEVVDPKQS